jgi:hypothetical protein
MNAGYADGHVETIRFYDTLTPHCQWDTVTYGIFDAKTKSTPINYAFFFAIMPYNYSHN